MNEIRALFTFLLVMAVSGCSLLSKPENVPVAKLTASYATLKIIEQAPPEEQQRRRERIRAIATEIQSVAKSDESATIPMLDALVRTRVPWGTLSPSDTILANTLIEVVEQELLARVGNSTIPKEQLIVISEVMTWIIDATKLGEMPQ